MLLGLYRIVDKNSSIPLYSISLHSIPFHSTLFYFTPFFSIPFSSIPFHLTLSFHPTLFCSIPLHSISLYFIHTFILLHSTSFHSVSHHFVALHSTLFCSILLYSIPFHSNSISRRDSILSMTERWDLVLALGKIFWTHLNNSWVRNYP